MKRKFVIVGAGSLVAVAALTAFNPATDATDSNESLNVEQWLHIGESSETQDAPGLGSLSSGKSARAGGRNTIAIGNYSSAGSWGFAFGQHATANGGVAMGDYAKALGFSSTALGYYTEATGMSVALGPWSESVGYASVSLGYTSRSIAERALAIGNDNRALGFKSGALGSDLLAYGRLNSVVGSFNDVGTATGADDPEAFHPDGHRFVIGDGTASNDRSNAMVIFNDGRTEFYGDVDAPNFLVNGSSVITEESIIQAMSNTIGLSRSNSADPYSPLVIQGDGVVNGWRNSLHSSGATGIVGWNNDVSYGNGSQVVGSRSNFESITNTLAVGRDNELVATDVVVALGRGLEVSSAEDLVLVGRYNSTVEEDDLFVVGGGYNDSFRVNPVSVNREGTTTLTSFRSQVPSFTGYSEEALIVNGATVLNGRVTLSQAQGDISMGIYGE